MEKNFKKISSSLFVIFVTYIGTILFNLQLFTTSLSHFVYGIVLLLLYFTTIYALYLYKQGKMNVVSNIVLIIGPIMTIMSLYDGFFPDKRFATNMPVLGWIYMIFGIRLVILGIKTKIKKNNYNNNINMR